MALSKPWSFSSLTSYETCPKRYQLTRVTKQVVEPQTEATTAGSRVHDFLERYALGSLIYDELPEDIKPMSRYVDKIWTYEGKRIVEQQLAVDRNLRPCDWDDPNAWCRGIIDIGVVGENTAYLLDWKTGKVKDDHDQLRLFAVLAFAHYPWIEKAVTGYIWLKFKKVTKASFTTADRGEIWGEYIQRVKRLELSFDNDKWVPRPSGLCKNWCPVGKKLCGYCGG